MNRTALGFLAAALLAGGAIGYVAGTSAGGGEIAVIGEEEAGPTFRPSPPPQDPGGEATAAFRYRNLRDALESIPVPRSERGSGSFTGRVTTEGGDPLGGVTVRAWARQKE